MTIRAPLIGRHNVAALIPSFREERNIYDVAKRAHLELDTVLVVDDGSPDRTESEARSAGVEVIRHAVNAGKGAAIKTGLRELGARAGIEYILILDGDGQHLPEEIPAFVAEANRTRALMLVGNRMVNLKGMPLVRKLTNLIMSSQVSAVCGQKIPDTQCGFRMVSRDLVDALCACQSSRYDFETEMLFIASRENRKIGAVPVSTVYGEEKSKIHPVRDTLRFIKLMRRLREELKAEGAAPMASH